MRARNIKPGFFKCEDLAECEPMARLLFVGLWCMADRDGRLEDRPRKIKGEIFPFDNCDVDSLLGQLETNGFVVRYQADERKVIQVINFAKHQRPHNKEAASELPENPEGKTRKIPGSTEKGSGQHQNGQTGTGLPSSSCALIPSSLIPSSLNSAPDEPAKLKKEAERRKEDPDTLFAALAKVTGSDAKTAASHIGKVCKLLRGADPPYEAADVFMFAEKIPALLPWVKGAPTLSIVQEHIGKIRNAGRTAADRPLGLPPELEERRRREQSEPNGAKE